MQQITELFTNDLTLKNFNSNMNLHLIVRNLLFSCRKFLLPPVNKGDKASKIIEGLILSSSPCMIARFGSSEIQGVLNGILPPPINIILQHRTYKHLIDNAGFFPVHRKNVRRFARLMIDSMKQCDCLASWRIEEVFFLNHLKQAKRIGLDSLGPVDNNANYNWYRQLRGKKILVVHPFAELIEYQYTHHRTRIWGDKEILPPFEKLETVKVVNSIGGRCDYSSWFEAFEAMIEEIKQKDFDIALIGCGAYGFPIAASIKRMGKKAIHIGGATQLIFGIKGKRWENAPYINEYWISPRPEDRPKGFEKVEGGCYW